MVKQPHLGQLVGVGKGQKRKKTRAQVSHWAVPCAKYGLVALRVLATHSALSLMRNATLALILGVGIRLVLTRRRTWQLVSC